MGGNEDVPGHPPTNLHFPRIYTPDDLIMGTRLLRELYVFPRTLSLSSPRPTPGEKEGDDVGLCTEIPQTLGFTLKGPVMFP